MSQPWRRKSAAQRITYEGLSTTMEVVTTYERYSEEPEYIGANKALLETLNLGAIRRVLDLACGTGLLTDLLLELCKGQSVIVNGRDISTESLDIGRRVFRKKGLLAS